MGRLISELDDDLLELPPGTMTEDEEVGVDDAEELLFQELDLGSEDIGLDTETAASADTFGAMVIDDGDESEDDPLDDSTLQVEADIDTDDDEQDWLEENDGTAAAGDWDDTLPDELGDEGGDDGGEEGVDDPLLDGLPDDPQRVRKHDDDDEGEGFEDDGLDDFARELGNDA